MNLSKIGRNDPCLCGSGKKYKNCCLSNDSSLNKSPQATSAESKILEMQRGWRLSQSGRIEEAKAVYHQIIQKFPKEAEAHHQIGILALQDGNIELAIHHLRLAVSLKNDNPQYFNNFGFAMHEHGNLEFAKEQYLKSIKLDPNYSDAYYNLHALLLSRDISSSIDCLKKILVFNPSDYDSAFMLGLLMDYSGNSDQAQAIFNTFSKESSLIQARIDAWNYLKSNKGSQLPIFGSLYETFKHAFQHTNQDGLVLEFGVRHGNSIRQIANLAKQDVHGFDSFEGLPEEWHHEAKGAYSTRGQLPKVPKNVTLHKGWFEDSIPEFCTHYGSTIRLLNIDCDLYSSTKTVLDKLSSYIVKGTVIIFDEYIGNMHWREDEFKAFQEAVITYGWQYKYLCFSFFTKQVAVQIL